MVSHTPNLPFHSKRSTTDIVATPTESLKIQTASTPIYITSRNISKTAADPRLEKITPINSQDVEGEDEVANDEAMLVSARIYNLNRVLCEPSSNQDYYYYDGHQE